MSKVELKKPVIVFKFKSGPGQVFDVEVFEKERVLDKSTGLSSIVDTDKILNIQEEVNSHFDSVNLDNKIRRFNDGDYTAIPSAESLKTYYADVSDMPTDLLSANKKAKDLVKKFNSIPDYLKKEFGSTPDEFTKNYTSENIARFNEKILAINAKKQEKELEKQDKKDVKKTDKKEND